MIRIHIIYVIHILRLLDFKTGSKDDGKVEVLSTWALSSRKGKGVWRIKRFLVAQSTVPARSEETEETEGTLIPNI